MIRMSGLRDRSKYIRIPFLSCSEQKNERRHHPGANEDLPQLLLGLCFLLIGGFPKLFHERPLIVRRREKSSFPFADGHEMRAEQLTELHLGQTEITSQLENRLRVLSHKMSA